MAILPILKYPDRRLRQISEPIRDFDDALKSLAEDMKETMLAAPGAGLAAPQVNRFLRLIVIDGSKEDEEYGQTVVTLINPRIVESTGKQIFREGCLSVEELQSDVIRSETVTVTAQDIAGQTFVISAKDRQAVILQHEIDHLDGILFLDHISRLKRDMYRKKLQKNLKLAKTS
ncbi:MAG: peptide deformylase [Deltaproteobacteria bacterium]|jgi:peptide deformylase|nr:peptide deformylase [Deltaproteobacteria bacterium]